MKNALPIFLALATTTLCCLPTPSVAQSDAPLPEQLAAQAKSSGDKELSSLATELTAKMESLGKSLTANPELKTKLDGILKSFTGGKDTDAVASAYKLAAGAKLTPEQTGLVKEVGNLASAYAVEKNFSGLEGSQGDVASVVASLRKGELTTLVPALQRIGQNAKLSPGQKELCTTLMDNYAPGLKKAASSLKDVKIPGF